MSTLMNTRRGYYYPYRIHHAVPTGRTCSLAYYTILHKLKPRRNFAVRPSLLLYMTAPEVRKETQAMLHSHTYWQVA